nr:MAG TPA: hypothetical protein [Caudoviricetes sp.]
MKNSSSWTKQKSWLHPTKTNSQHQTKKRKATSL